MYYCFVEEDLTGLSDADPLMIQVKYAKHLGLFCCCHLTNGTVTDQKTQTINLECKQVFLRATCSTTVGAMELLNRLGADLVETMEDIHAIEHWDSLSLSKRQIFSVQSDSLFAAAYPSQIEEFLVATPQVFIKSREKNFCVQLPSRKLLEGNAEVLAFFREHNLSCNNEFMLSELLEVKSDSLGPKEARFFVLNGMIANASRTIHSIQHNVPRRFLEKGIHLAKSVSAAQSAFPRNYVIDIGEFTKEGEAFLDIVEMNPVTSSLCYVNNSIFTMEDTEIIDIQKRIGMGAEYCYDSIEKPDRYSKSRCSGITYTYYNTNYYSF